MLRLRELRTARKINQQELANYLGITQATLSGWETGKYDIDNQSLSKCADYFGVTTDCVLGREPVPDPSESPLDHVYLSLAKDAQEKGIDPEDIRIAIETINRLKKK